MYRYLCCVFFGYYARSDICKCSVNCLYGLLFAVDSSPDFPQQFACIHILFVVLFVHLSALLFSYALLSIISSPLTLLTHILHQQVNAIIERCAFGRARLSPEAGNVVFASAKYGFCFSLPSFAKKYADYHGGFAANQVR